MQNKNPFTAAIINFFFWGLGYVYCEKRIAFGCLIFAGFLLVHFPLIYEKNLFEIPAIFTLAGHIVISFAFAIDVIKPAKIKRGIKKELDIKNQSASPFLTK